MKINLLKLLLMYKRMDYLYLDNSFILKSNRAYCEGMSLGFKIEDIFHTKNTAKAVIGHTEHQMLTNVIRFHNMSLMASRNHRVFLNDQKMTLVLKNLGIVPKLNGKRR